MSQNIIDNASYLVYEGTPTKDSISIELPGGVKCKCKNVTFYTFDGEPIITLEHDFRFPRMDEKLDPKAPKPKPVSYRKIYWPAIHIGFGMEKGCPGYFVLFHDKNNNRMGCSRIEGPETDVLSTITNYDLSNAFEEQADYSYQPKPSYSICTIS